MEIIHSCFEEGKPIKLVSEETGYSRTSIYKWRRIYLAGGAALLIGKKKYLPREEIKAGSISKTNQGSGELITKIKDLELENDILKEKKISAST